MRIQLIAQHLQLRFLCESGCLEHRFTLDLQRLVILDAEIQGAPAKQQVGRRQRAEEKLKQGSEVPARLNEIPVGDIDDDAQDERRRVTGGEYADNDRTRRAAPESAVDEAQR